MEITSLSLLTNPDLKDQNIREYIVGKIFVIEQHSLTDNTILFCDRIRLQYGGRWIGQGTGIVNNEVHFPS